MEAESCVPAGSRVFERLGVAALAAILAAGLWGLCLPGPLPPRAPDLKLERDGGRPLRLRIWPEGRAGDCVTLRIRLP